MTNLTDTVTDVQRIADIMEKILFREHNIEVTHSYEHKITPVVRPERIYEKHEDIVTILNMELSEYDAGHIECKITPNDGGESFSFPIRIATPNEEMTRRQQAIVADYLVEQLLYWQ